MPLALIRLMGYGWATFRGLLTLLSVSTASPLWAAHVWRTGSTVCSHLVRGLLPQIALFKKPEGYLLFRVDTCMPTTGSRMQPWSVLMDAGTGLTRVGTLL